MSRESRLWVEWKCDECGRNYGWDGGDTPILLRPDETADDWTVVEGKDLCDECSEERACVAAGGHDWSWEPFGIPTATWEIRSCSNCPATESRRLS